MQPCAAAVSRPMPHSLREDDRLPRAPFAQRYLWQISAELAESGDVANSYVPRCLRISSLRSTHIDFIYHSATISYDKLQFTECFGVGAIAIDDSNS
jgi:hypothetical protein